MFSTTLNQQNSTKPLLCILHKKEMDLKLSPLIVIVIGWFKMDT